ncbi:pilus (MSHA type) biogenesis protein MshL [Campylobacter fetus]|uniref:Pilus (MSHA type) biogenesis protein MshL n=3 Tax=Campylobacter fetus TaxID=196 RepID=A0A5L8V6Y4_CAMFE|nr:pilus (MSHA type) biogenesis protein MshL [Campylobacter fetus]OCS23215.1 secretin [Campylobacter fetus subsp. venerealis cfvi97/532]OCS26750.1 secretin [Campylobacter fetus subsp. venerealis cfvB10]OCS30582.1 secretin [Campylobacter fetus subsp. venerealis LMG 6570 = CCUG 33900]OCS41181.1 secretin [Campylobacter fetus subsp. venerealis cfvi02/298]ABK83176.1 type II and III secretion system protein [Campylobacter fetus subsp. fetus 82-40]
MSLLITNKNIFKILTILAIFFSTEALANECKSRVFNIKISNSVSTAEILNQLSDMCHFSIIQNDEYASQVLQNQISGINIKDMTLKEIFDILINQNNLDYTFYKNILKISSMQTKMFKIDYITSVREGTAIIKASVDSSPSEVGGNNNNNNNSNTNDQAGYGLDNHIKTTEKFDFWQNLNAELKAILNNGSEKLIAPDPVINTNAGLITVTGTNTQLKRVGDYLNQLENRLKKQVMIDVSIIAVELSNSYTKGIDWSKFELGFNSYLGNDPVTGAPSSIQFGTGSAGNPAQSLRNITGGFVLGGGINLSMDGVLNFLETKGRTKVVSSPKIMTMNNQQALITVGDNINYRVQEDTTNNNTQTAVTNTTYTQYSIFIGILLNLLPEVSDDGRIMLRINPSLSSFKYGDDNRRQANIREIAPDTLQKKLSTVVQVNSGDTIILGGLIGETKGKDNTSVPVLGDIPLFGNLFKSTKDSVSTTELIFIITPKVINNETPKQIRNSLKELGFSESVL